jgi:hypothetical protein
MKKKKTDYKCGHNSKIILMSKASLANWLIWKDTTGIDGDKTECYPCFIKRLKMAENINYSLRTIFKFLDQINGRKKRRTKYMNVNAENYRRLISKFIYMDFLRYEEELQEYYLTKEGKIFRDYNGEILK